MDSSLRLKRHTQLWKDGESRVRRIGIGGAIFSLLILLTVVEPFHIESSKTRDQLQKKRAQETQIRAEQEGIVELDKQLAQMTAGIEQEPWTDEITRLKNRFSDGEITNPREQSNDTLGEISRELKQTIVIPLGKATAGLDEDNDLAGVDKRIEAEIDRWFRRYSETNWWITRDAKDDAAAAIGDEIGWILDDAADVADSTRKELTRLSAENKKQLKELDTDIKALNTKLTKVMNGLLPTWARNIIDVEALLILFPLLLAGIAAYLLATAYQASRHFHAMADGEGWSGQDRQDPLLSSAWTLTARGPRGTAAVIATYGVVLGVLATCLYRSQNPPTKDKEASVDQTIALISTQSSLYTTIAYGMILAAVIATAVLLFRSQSPSDEEQATNNEPR